MASHLNGEVGEVYERSQKGRLLMFGLDERERKWFPSKLHIKQS